MDTYYLRSLLDGSCGKTGIPLHSYPITDTVLVEESFLPSSQFDLS